MNQALIRQALCIYGRLPDIAHFNILVHAHKNAYEPATSLQLWQNSGSSSWQVLWQL
jgi:hypothetical protein